MKTITFQEKGLDWLSHHLSYFDPRIDSAVASKSIQLKAFVELIFLYNMFDRGSIFARHTTLKTAVEKFINTIIDEIDFNHYSILESGFLPVPAIIEEYKKRTNRSQITPQKLEEQVAFNLDILSRKIPYRQLDVQYSLHQAGIQSNISDEDQLFHKTTLGKLKNQLLLSEDAVYSITHTIFYLTDMGRLHAACLSSSNFTDLLLSLIVYYQVAENMDILSELIISIYFLNTNLTKGQYHIIQRAMDTLYVYQDCEHGFIPSPGFTNSDGKEEDFFENYHTTMVALGANYVFEKGF